MLIGNSLLSEIDEDLQICFFCPKHHHGFQQGKVNELLLQRLQNLLDLLNDVQVLEATEEIARKFGEVRASLFDSGTSVPEMDLFIAATALEHGLTVVTRNLSDFAPTTVATLDPFARAG